MVVADVRDKYEASPEVGLLDSGGADLLAGSELRRRESWWGRLSELDRDAVAADFASAVILDLIGQRVATFKS